MARFESINPWNPEQEVWILTSLAKGESQADIYRMLTGEQPGRPDDIPEWHGKEQTFRMRIRKMTGANPDIRQQKKSQPDDCSDEFLNISPDDISNLDSQIQWLKDFITKSVKAKPGDRLRALGMLRELQEKFDTEQNDELSDEFTVANPLKVTLTTELITEFIMTMRNDYGGIENIIKFDVLRIDELERLQQIIDQTLAEKQIGLHETEIVEENKKDEDNT